MMTIYQAWDIITDLNDEAYDMAYEAWEKADIAADNDDDELAEELREEASILQSSHFSLLFDQCPDEQKNGVMEWKNKDAEFREQLMAYFGEVNE